MKELEQRDKEKLEISVQQKKKIEYELLGFILPHDGHKIWQINKDTLEIEEAKFSNATYKFGEENKKEILTKDGYVYISALNKMNALKKYKQGTNGSKKITKDPLPLYKMKKQNKKNV